MFRDLQGYKGYAVNNLGVVISNSRVVSYKNNRGHHKHKERVLKFLIKNGYHYVCLSVNGKRKHEPVHRLVAIEFIPNPENKKFINHKNGIKNDNRVENLEWCTTSENGIHSYRVLQNKHGMLGKFKRAIIKCVCGNEFRPARDTSTYCSISCATRNQSRFNKNKTPLQ